MAAEFDWRIPKGFPRPKVPTDNPVTQAKVELGRYLFYDKRLSANGVRTVVGAFRPHLYHPHPFWLNGPRRRNLSLHEMTPTELRNTRVQARIPGTAVNAVAGLIVEPALRDRTRQRKPPTTNFSASRERFRSARMQEGSSP